MDPIRRPDRVFIAPGAMRKLHDVAGGDIHDKNIVISRLKSARPLERDVLAIGTPGWIVGFALAGGQARHVGTINTHSIYLGRASAAGNENNLGSGFWIRLGFDIDRAAMGEATDVSAIDIGDEDGGFFSAGGRVSQQMAAVGQKIGRGIERGLLIVVDQFAIRFERIDLDLRLAEVFLGAHARTKRVGIARGCQQRVSGESELRAVGRNYREIGDRAVGSELLLVRAVVIHGPDFLMASAIGDEIDARADQAGGAELLEDVGCEFLDDFAGARFVQRADIDFAEDLRRRRIGLFDVVQPAVEDDLIIADRSVAEREVVGIDGRPGPVGEPETLAGGGLAEIRGLLGHLQRVEGFGGHLELAGVLQITEQGVVERSHQALRVAGAPEVGDGDHGLFAGLVDRAGNVLGRDRTDEKNGADNEGAERKKSFHRCNWNLSSTLAALRSYSGGSGWKGAASVTARKAE